MAVSKFTPGATRAAKAPAKAVSRFAGITAASTRTPQLNEGSLTRFRIEEIEETATPGKGTTWIKIHGTVVGVVEGDAKLGKKYTQLYSSNGKGGPSGIARYKAQVMAAAGFDDQSAFDAYDNADGDALEAFLGADNAYSKRGDTILGRLVDIETRRGNPTPDGLDYYREYAFGVVPEDEQEDTSPPALTELEPA